MKSALSDFHVQFCSMSSSSNWQFGGTLYRLISILILFVAPVSYVPLRLGRGYINANNLKQVHINIQNHFKFIWIKNSYLCPGVVIGDLNAPDT